MPGQLSGQTAVGPARGPEGQAVTLCPYRVALPVGGVPGRPRALLQDGPACLLPEQLRRSPPRRTAAPPAAGTFFSGCLCSSAWPALPRCLQTPAFVTPAAEQTASSGLGCGPPRPSLWVLPVGQVVVSPSRWGFLRGQLSVSSILLPRTQEHLRAGSPACAAFLRQPQRRRGARVAGLPVA